MRLACMSTWTAVPTTTRPHDCDAPGQKLARNESLGLLWHQAGAQISVPLFGPVKRPLLATMT